MTYAWVLMYHRVCARGPGTACAFERGTAVTPEAFEAQLRWIMERFDVVPLAELVHGDPPSRRPRVALTFDDGYQEILDCAGALCDACGVPATCFAPAATILGPHALWFDTYYEAVEAGRSSSRVLELARAWGFEMEGATLREWVTGALKRHLAALPLQERDERVKGLAAAAGVAPPVHLYLSGAGLRTLASAGWTVGGHGLWHRPLAACDEDELARELAMSSAIARTFSPRGPSLLAYPDGDWDERVSAAAGRAGFEIACTVERGPVTGQTRRLAVPRLFCRGDGQVPHPLLAEAAVS